MMSAVAVAVAFGARLGTSPFLGASDAGATPRLGTAAVGQTARSEPSAALALAKSDASTQATVTPELAYDLGPGERQGGTAWRSRLLRLCVRHLPRRSHHRPGLHPDHNGYWLIGADGSVYPFGDAKNEAVPGARVRPDPVVAATTTPDGGGYWLVTSSGQVMAFGDAKDYGSITTPIRAHVVGMVPTTDGKGYWIAAVPEASSTSATRPSHGSAKAGTPGLANLARREARRAADTAREQTGASSTSRRAASWTNLLRWQRDIRSPRLVGISQSPDPQNRAGGALG